MITPKAKKYLWQNFLKNKKILDLIVGSTSLEGKNVFEVWPGPGDLTDMILSKNPLSLKLIELDPDMIPFLEKRFSEKSFDIYLQDVLDTSILLGETEKHEWIHIHKNEKIILSAPYDVYGNIPYYITSPILHHFLYSVDLSPQVATFTMQKEVAARILSTTEHTVLSLSCQLMSDIEKVCDISPNNFIPVPKVWSTCLRFTLKKTDKQASLALLALIKKWFSQKRKKLTSNLGQSWYSKDKIVSTLISIGISENIRAEELSLDQWKDLSLELKSN